MSDHTSPLRTARIAALAGLPLLTAVGVAALAIYDLFTGGGLLLDKCIGQNCLPVYHDPSPLLPH